MRVFAVAALCLWLAACTTTQTKTAFKDPKKPPPGARVLLLQPDVQLALLTAGGVTEPRADWSESGRANLSRDIEAALKTRSHAYGVLDPSTAMTGRVGQLLRLHGAVGQAIQAHSYGPYRLPTKKEFDWTLGQGAQELASAHQADYALFVTSRGTYASGGRMATAVGLSLVGVAIPLGQQQVYASLVDLKTGRVIWFNVAVAGPNADMREASGSASLVQSLLKDLPL